MNPVERSPGVEGVFATQSAPVAASVNVMSVKVPPTSIASVQVLATGPAIVDRGAAPGKMRPRQPTLEPSATLPLADGSGADWRARRRFVV